jgi:hypothetical protein
LSAFLSPPQPHRSLSFVICFTFAAVAIAAASPLP